MKTSRSGFSCVCSRLSSSRLSATSGRSLSVAMRTFFDGQAKLVQRRAQRLNGEIRLKLCLELPKRQVWLLSDDLSHPVGNPSPQGHASSRQARRNLVEFATLLFDASNPRLADVEVRGNLARPATSIAGRQHLSAELF